MKHFTLFSVVVAISFSLDVQSAGISDSTLPASPVATSVVPADYNPEKHILLVAEIHKPHDIYKKDKFATQMLDKSMKAYFPYKYEIVSYKEMETSSKYSDTSVYRYALINELTSENFQRNAEMVNGSMHGPSTVNEIYIDFHFYDRISNNNYLVAGKRSPYLSQGIRPFMELVPAEVKKRK